MIPSPSMGEGQGWECFRPHQRELRGRRCRLERKALNPTACTPTQPSPIEGEGL